MTGEQEWTVVVDAMPPNKGKPAARLAKSSEGGTTGWALPWIK